MRHIVTVCGISGSVCSTAGAASAAIPRQLACQHHRGPDAEGWFDGGLAAIGQNRLSIIDVAGGDPPITEETGRIGAVLNGEIYNFGALREQLLGAGHRFATHGDTEVIAHLAEDLTPVELARRLDGMFALAVWDRRRERLVLARDRLGKKPLHYWCADGSLVFASEIKGVLAHPAVPRELDAAALPAYLTFGYVPTPRTFFSGIRTLPPGHVLSYEPGGEPRIEPYWSLQIPGEHLDIELDEAADEVRRLLGHAIRRRLVSDVPLGAFLSGGIDSSAIVALMAEQAEGPVRTFTIGFDDHDGFDERPHARRVAARYGTQHHEEVVEPAAVDLVERLVWHHDQPFGDSSAIPTYLLAQVTRRHVTVALSGDGGDELFGGYERFAAGAAVAGLLRVPAPLRRGGGALLQRRPPGGLGGRAGRAARLASTLERGMPEAYLGWINYVGADWCDRLLPGGDDWARRAYTEAYRRSAGASTLDRLLQLNAETYLVDDLLVKVDRMSMAHGLEVRSPFLDTALVEFAVRLPPRLKVRGLSLKRVLKRAVRDDLPPDLLDRRKQGFGVPLDRWFRHELRSFTAAALGPGARLRGHLRGDALDAMFEAHQAGADLGHALWTLLTLELFLRRNDW